MLLDDVADYIEEQNLGTVGEHIFKSSMPDDPDEAIGLYVMGGEAPDEVLKIERPGLHIRVRATTFPAAELKARLIKEKLHMLSRVTLGSTFYYLIEAKHEPEQAGEDDRGRTYMTLDFSVEKETET